MSKTETGNSKVPSAPPKNLSAALQGLEHGNVIIFPTETLYGLGADALNVAAVEKVFMLKGRDPQHPIPVLVADQEMLHTLVAHVPSTAQKLMKVYWPGPLTLVLPGQKGIPKPLCNSAGGIGVRISSQPIANLIIKGLGHPLTATSANPSGKEPARTIQEAKSYFAGQVKIFVDGGTLKSPTGSTVVEAMEKTIKIIRQGEISLAELRQVLGAKNVFG